MQLKLRSHFSKYRSIPAIVERKNPSIKSSRLETANSSLAILHPQLRVNPQRLTGIFTDNDSPYRNASILSTIGKFFQNSFQGIFPSALNFTA